MKKGLLLTVFIPLSYVLYGQVIFFPDSGSQTYTTCHAILYDSGGDTAYYGANEHGLVTICPPDSGKHVGIIFYYGDLAPGIPGDRLKIYNGTDTTASLLQVFSGGIPDCGVIASTNTNGCLTLEFTSDNTGGWGGWKASVFCYPSFPTTLIPGMNCSNAVPLSIPDSMEFETTACHADYVHSGGCIPYYTEGREKFYRYNATAPGCLAVTVSNIVTLNEANLYPTRAILSVWQGCPGSGGVCMGYDSSAINSTLFGNFNLPAAGMYYITIEDRMGVSVYLDYNIQIGTCDVGIGETDTVNTFSIFPNPTEGIFTLQGVFPKESTIVTRNVLGELVLVQRISGEKTEFDLGRQENGMYFLEVHSGNLIFVKKLFLQK